MLAKVAYNKNFEFSKEKNNERVHRLRVIYRQEMQAMPPNPITPTPFNKSISLYNSAQGRLIKYQDQQGDQKSW